MRKKPQAVLFDLFGTLVSLEPVRHALVDAGLPEFSLELAQARALRDGVALEAAGLFRRFGDLFQASVRGLDQNRADVNAAIGHHAAMVAYE